MKTDNEILENKDPFEKFLFLISYYLHEDEKAIKILTDSNFNILTDIVTPLRKHFDNTLLKYETLQGKKDYLKYVIYQFSELQYFWQNHDEDIQGTQEKTLSGKQKDQFAQYVFCSWELFNIVMNEIQISCFTFSLDFFKICDEIHFETDTFCSGLTLAIQEKYKTGETKKSFSWTGSDEQLKKLHNELIKHGCIDPTTNLEAFTAIFAGDVINDNLLPVTWIKKTKKSKTIAKSEVIALFDCLANSDKILMNETVNRAELFRKLQYCLSDEAGNPLRFEHSHTKTSKSNTDFYKQLTSSL